MNVPVHTIVVWNREDTTEDPSLYLSVSEAGVVRDVRQELLARFEDNEILDEEGLAELKAVTNAAELKAFFDTNFAYYDSKHSIEFMTGDVE